MSHIIAGIVSIILGITGVIFWWENFGMVLRGSLPILILICGLLAVSTGLQMKDPGK
ncbi:MAG: hypothetical protein HQL31_07865 [Planctomycetes bacterium]|nr:hypothetical protein [Planctomycetota bacterium]